MIPLTAFAVEFEISEVQIDVKLHDDGNAEVIEKHTYDFDSKFNGITREVVPTMDSSIIEFKAFENGKPLKTEKELNTYKVFRSGKKETVHFELHYKIINAVDKYEDGAEFIWPFFDDRNKAEYGDMQITVYPPEKASEIDHLGYDAAYQKGSIGYEGAVTFKLGKVPKKTKGDIRVIYEPILFPHVEASNGTIRDQLRNDEVQLAEALAKFNATQETMRKVGLYTIISFALFLFGLFTYMFMKRRGTKRIAQSMAGESFIPKEKLTMPATIYYTKPSGLGPEMISASLLDLIRKGRVKQIEEESFELVDGSEMNEHETALIDLLFHKVGDGTRFSLTDLKVYTDKEENHKTYGAGLEKWRSGIIQEVKKAKLFEKKAGLRWTVGLVSLALIPIIVQLGRYDVFLYMAMMIVLALTGLIIALFYYPRNLEGFQLKTEWGRFRERFENLDTDSWEQLPVDDKYRAYIYGIGVKDGNLERLYTEFQQAEQRSNAEQPYFAPYNPVFMTQSFTTANTTASVDVSGSSTSVSSGGGVGGGGGGSGAF